ncbi:MAG: hypothetical protein KGZ25_07180 [Planctomycetes bacterium]|nr:hypothetical protein [Planctomycetota bacterium]
MKKKAAIIAGILLAVAGIIYWRGFDGKEKAKKDRSTEDGFKEIQTSDKMDEPETIRDRKKPEKGQLLPEGYFPDVEIDTDDIEGDEYVKCVSEFSEEGVRIEIPLGVPTDVAMVELRFRWPEGSEHDSLPYVESLYINSWQNGHTIQQHDDDIRGSHNVRGHTYVSGAAPPGKYSMQTLWRFGRQYALQYLVGAETSAEGEWYQNVIEIPEHIPRGRTYCITLPIENPVAEGDWYVTSSLKPLEGKITTPLPCPPKQLLVYYSEVGSGEWVERMVKEAQGPAKARFSLKTKTIGGMLRISRVTEQKGQCWMYIRSVSKRRLVLPRDADITMNKEDLRGFEFRLPEQAIKPNLQAIGLKIERDDPVPVSWTRVARHTKTGEGVAFHLIPGQYWISARYLVDNGRAVDDNLIGKITVKKSDAGKTLEVQPLEE